MANTTPRSSLRVCIVGAGIGGLTCAIACRLQGLAVRVLEQAPEILPVGAGIQIPPNSSIVLQRLGVLPQLQKVGTDIKTINFRRYQNGKLLASKPIKYDTPWLLVHRADYHRVLMDHANALGVEITLGANVKDVDFVTGDVQLEDGRAFDSDVVVGADGLWSTVRTQMLGYSSAPVETGDLAYRATFSRRQLKELNDTRIDDLCNEEGVTVWMGPDRHCVFYQVRGGEQMNMVLLRPDNLPAGARTVNGDVEEMRQTFEGWDDVLLKLISCIPATLKWKLMHHDELDTWVKGRFALLGDACHPTLPYQAQGAAMAVEDGAIIGHVLGRLNQDIVGGLVHHNSQATRITQALEVYERYQKRRTTINVQGAVNHRLFFHLPDGPEQEHRDNILAKHTWTDERSEYKWCDMGYDKLLLQADVLRDIDQAMAAML